jgi:hypothetical protein
MTPTCRRGGLAGIPPNSVGRSSATRRRSRRSLPAPIMFPKPPRQGRLPGPRRRHLPRRNRWRRGSCARSSGVIRTASWAPSAAGCACCSWLAGVAAAQLFGLLADHHRTHRFAPDPDRRRAPTGNAGRRGSGPGLLARDIVERVQCRGRGRILLRQFRISSISALRPVPRAPSGLASKEKRLPSGVDDDEREHERPRRRSLSCRARVPRRRRRGRSRRPGVRRSCRRPASACRPRSSP